MPKRFLSLFMAFVMLTCGAILPATVEAMEFADTHATELFETTDHGVSDQHQGSGDNQEAPCHAVTHHHCGAALRADVPHIRADLMQISLRGWPPYEAPMKSRSIAPPIQPPSA